MDLADSARDLGISDGAAHTGHDLPTPRYYQVVFIWMRDAPTFAHYLELAAPVVGRYGGALERMLLPDLVVGDGMRKPDVVNVVSYDSAAAFAALDADPDFQQIVPLRSASIDMIAIDGLPSGGLATEHDLADRIYLLELAQYGALGAEGYAALEAQVEPLMRPFGYHLERRIAPQAAPGMPFLPDVVKVAYFDDAAGLEGWHQDPAHPRIEQELYPAAAQQAIWLVARVHPLSLDQAPQ
jgi:uncharacterized protein (DUF1330 family)